MGDMWHEVIGGVRHATDAPMLMHGTDRSGETVFLLGRVIGTVGHGVSSIRGIGLARKGFTLCLSSMLLWPQRGREPPRAELRASVDLFVWYSSSQIFSL